MRTCWIVDLARECLARVPKAFEAHVGGSHDLASVALSLRAVENQLNQLAGWVMDNEVAWEDCRLVTISRNGVLNAQLSRAGVAAGDLAPNSGRSLSDNTLARLAPAEATLGWSNGCRTSKASSAC